MNENIETNQEQYELIAEEDDNKDDNNSLQIKVNIEDLKDDSESEELSEI